MTEKIGFLMENSRLPGPRGNLELLYSFSESATEEEIEECLTFCGPDVRNSPEEFVSMCGVVGTCVRGQQDPATTLRAVRPYASNGSWRVREAVAIGIQRMFRGNLREIVDHLQGWVAGNELEQRAVVAGLCEPRLLRDPHDAELAIRTLERITAGFERIDGKLTEPQAVLRKALGYGWSVAIVALPDTGKPAFEKLSRSQNRHVRWIVRENLRKNRLRVLDQEWVNGLVAETT